jgi:hypothetical protein
MGSESGVVDVRTDVGEVERGGANLRGPPSAVAGAGVSFAEYCRSFDLDLGKWYRVKQALARKGVTVAATSVLVAEVRNVAAAKPRPICAAPWIR